MTFATASPSSLAAASRYLTQRDPRLAPVIAAVGPCSIRPHSDYYRSLVQSIVGQQLSILAAAAINKRFVEHFGGTFPTPQQLVMADAEDLRGLGLSWAKTRYIHDLAEHIIDGRINFDAVDSMTNQEIVNQLTAVKGIGEWTVHMFLMFCVGRLDVLPTGDLGIRNGVQALYGLPLPVKPADVTAVATTNGWHPYESIASWYVWQSLKLL